MAELARFLALETLLYFCHLDETNEQICISQRNLVVGKLSE